MKLAIASILLLSLLGCKTHSIAPAANYSGQERDAATEELLKSTQAYLQAQALAEAQAAANEERIDAEARIIAKAIAADMNRAMQAIADSNQAAVNGALARYNQQLAEEIARQNDAGCHQSPKPKTATKEACKSSAPKTSQPQVAVGATISVLGGLVALSGLAAYLNPQLADHFGFKKYRDEWRANRAVVGDINLETEAQGKNSVQTLKALSANPVAPGEAMRVAIFGDQPFKFDDVATQEEFKRGIEKLAKGEVLLEAETATMKHVVSTMPEAVRPVIQERLDARYFQVVSKNPVAAGVEAVVAEISDPDLRGKIDAARAVVEPAERVKRFSEVTTQLQDRIAARDKATVAGGRWAMAIGALSAGIGIIVASTALTGRAYRYESCKALSAEKKEVCRADNRKRYLANIHMITKGQLGVAGYN